MSEQIRVAGFSEQSRRATSNKRILLVDDEEAIRTTCATLLTERGYEVLTAADGEEALARFRRSGDTIDLVLLDNTLPRMSGARVLERLLAARSDVKVVVMSGDLASLPDPAEALPGAAGFLEKPFLFPQLVALVESMVHCVE